MSKATHSQSTTRNNATYGKGLLVRAAVLLMLPVTAATFFIGCSDKPSADETVTARQAALASEHSPTVGEPEAKVHIVEFLDPACGTCALFYPIVKGWMAEVPGEIRLSVRHVAFHDGADYVVRILEASRNQDRYWQTLEALLAAQRQWVHNHIVQPDRVGPVIAGLGLDMEQLETDMNSAEVLRRIEKDQQDAITLKVSATPEYFVNGRPLPSFGQEQLANLVREELAR
jgi:protein-disulfide isomerase